MTSRENILSLFRKQNLDYNPLFSGLISVTEAGLASEGLQFHETHRDVVKMARAAASTYRVSEFGSAVVPLDLCVEAEALGARVDFREDSKRAEYPRVEKFLYKGVEEFTAHRPGVLPGEIATPALAGSAREIAEKNNKENSAGSAISAVKQGRIPMVCQAIKILKEDVGQEIVIGGYIPGPFTLLSLLVETGELYMSLRKPGQVHIALERLAQFLAIVGNAYHEAGADFLTVHEMGGSPGALGPKTFESVVLPHLQVLFSELPRPAVLSACGRTNGAMKTLAASGADALSVDQTNDLVASRQEVPDVLLFGNLDPVGLISQGTPDDITAAVERAARSGADAIWPGCDLFPQTPLENLRALVEASKKPSV
jgi:[methyl-Co(III) methanol-specific corrinoid protein]:coenzyme M methyltransferase